MILSFVCKVDIRSHLITETPWGPITSRLLWPLRLPRPAGRPLLGTLLQVCPSWSGTPPGEGSVSVGARMYLQHGDTVAWGGEGRCSGDFIE